MYLCALPIRILSIPETVVAEEYAFQRNFTLPGIIVREEIPIVSPNHKAISVAADGQAVAAGSIIAICGDEPVLAPAAGIYTPETDGFEHLTADMLSDISLDKTALLQNTNAPKTPYLGKIICGNIWMFVATAEPDCTDTLQEGQSVNLTVQVTPSFEVTATVIHISSEQQGKCAVVFRCIDRLQHIYHLRQLTVFLSDTAMEGLRIPTKAIHTDEAGSFVYILSASKAKKTYVTVVSSEDDFTIVAKDDSAHALRAGDTIIVSTPPT